MTTPTKEFDSWFMEEGQYLDYDGDDNLIQSLFQVWRSGQTNLLDALEDLYYQASSLCNSCGSWIELEQTKQAIKTAKGE